MFPRFLRCVSSLSTFCFLVSTYTLCFLAFFIVFPCFLRCLPWVVDTVCREQKKKLKSRTVVTIRAWPACNYTIPSRTLSLRLLPSFSSSWPAPRPNYFLLSTASIPAATSSHRPHRPHRVNSGHLPEVNHPQDRATPTLSQIGCRGYAQQNQDKPFPPSLPKLVCFVLILIWNYIFPLLWTMLHSNSILSRSRWWPALITLFPSCNKRILCLF